MRKRTVAESAYIAGVCERTINRALKSGELPFERSGGRVLICEEDLKAYARNRALPELQRLARITRIFTEDHGPVAA